MKKIFKILRDILSGGILINPAMRRLYPFLLFLAVLALLWIANTYSAISIQKNIADTKEDLKKATDELKRQETTYTDNSRPSQLIRKLEKDSIKMAHNATYKIITNKNEGGNHE